jgi:hypothetical protein
VLQRGERIELLVDKTDDLRNQVCHVTTYYAEATPAADAASMHALANNHALDSPKTHLQQLLCFTANFAKAIGSHQHCRLST